MLISGADQSGRTLWRHHYRQGVERGLNSFVTSVVYANYHQQRETKFGQFVGNSPPAAILFKKQARQQSRDRNITIQEACRRLNSRASFRKPALAFPGRAPIHDLPGPAIRFISVTLRREAMKSPSLEGRRPGCCHKPLRYRGRASFEARRHKRFCAARTRSAARSSG